MKIIISNSSPMPIYGQIKSSIISQIINNELSTNEPLPSIRNLAQNIKISVMTVKKAYDELEKEGYIISVQGKGTFIAPKNTELYLENVKKEIEEYINNAVNLAIKCNVKKEDVHNIVNIFYGRDN